MRQLISYTVLIFLVLFGAYLCIELIPSDRLGGIDRVRIISDRISIISSESWKFVRPLLQLAFIILIFQFLIERFGPGAESLKFVAADFKSLLALIVVCAFCLASLSGSEGAGSLKDVALVVIGFYFGGLSKKPEGPPTP